MVDRHHSDDFHPLLRHHLVNTLAWRSLRPLQEEAAHVILSGSHALVLAPTAGGKTEAAVFPVISRLLTEEWEGTSILYICPLKALLNNLHPRLEQYFSMVGHGVGLWHGDVPESARTRILKQRHGCLLTTPESLEVMLVSTRRERQEFLRDVRVVIVDEIHAFAGDDRGTHLLCLLERIAELAARPIQRIGLSATVGNPDELLTWLTAKREEKKSIVSTQGSNTECEVKLDYVGSLDNAALVLSQIYQGEKRLVFCDSRRRVEELTHALTRHGVRAFASHSSLSAESRRESEAAFERERDCVIVATSTLELGIDVGDLDRVIQIDAPGTVASFLQRIGRTGRRTGTTRNCLFLTTTPLGLLQAAALIQLWEEGFVEPIRPPRNPFHLLAQQLMALCLQKGTIDKHSWKSSIARVSGIADMDSGEVDRVIEHLIARGYLFWDETLISMGDEAEKAFGRRHFMELLSVFSTSPMFEVFHGRTSIGYLDSYSLNLPKKETRPTYILGGRGWELEDIDWKQRRVYVSPSHEKGRSVWKGASMGLSFVATQAILNLLKSNEKSDRWTARALDEVSNQRLEFEDLVSMNGTLFSHGKTGHLCLPTFFGSIINQIIADAIRFHSNAEVKVSDFELTFSDTKDSIALKTLIRDQVLPTLPDPLTTPDTALENLKFATCLSRDLAAKAFLGRLDIPSHLKQTLSTR